MPDCYLLVRYLAIEQFFSTFKNLINYLIWCVPDERVSVLDVSRDKVIHLKTAGLQKTKGASSFTLDVKVNKF